MKPASRWQRFKKPANARTRRHLKEHEPKEVEELKQALLIGGHQLSQLGKDALTELHKLKYLESVVLTRKHVGLAPFEEGGEVELEKLSERYDCGLFVVANHTKSKPHNLVFGRFFDHRIYDLVELGIVEFQSISDFAPASALPQGIKPCFVFMGERFVSDPKMQLVKSVFLDFFRGREVKGMVFDGLMRLMVVMAVDSERVLLRQFKVSPRKQCRGNAGPEDFVECGPRFDFVLRRTRQPPTELEEQALVTPSKRKREKNVQLDSLDNKVGAVYVPSQEVDRIVTARHKGFKRMRREAREHRRQQRTEMG